MTFVVSLSLPASLSQILSPKSKPFFKIKPEVVKDKIFKERLSDSMHDWKEVRDLGLDVLTWWEIMVKPGIRKLAIQRSKELNRESRGLLNLLLLRQSYLARKVQTGHTEKLAELRTVQAEIESWYEKESKKVVLQAKTDDVCQSEKVRIYQHEEHEKIIHTEVVNNKKK